MVSLRKPRHSRHGQWVAIALLVGLFVYVWMTNNARTGTVEPAVVEIVGSTVGETYHRRSEGYTCKYVNEKGEHFTVWGIGQGGVSEAERHSMKPCPNCFLTHGAE